jgi:hypothetical protein
MILVWKKQKFAKNIVRKEISKKAIIAIGVSETILSMLIRGK